MSFLLFPLLVLLNFQLLATISPFKEGREKMEHDSQEEDMVMAGGGGGGGGSYNSDSPANSTQVKRPSPVDGPLAMMVVVRNTGKGGFGECLKNHATRFNGHALDGCLEFIAAGPEGTIDALKCAACDCHRNYHRKDAPFPNGNPYHPVHHHPPPSPQCAACYRAAAPTGHLHVARPNPGAMLALPAGGRAQFTREVEYHEDVVSDRSGGGDGGGGGGGSNSKPKGFRTKFSHEQKGKMLEFAERADWRIQKLDENAVQEFCNEIGVNRHVLKVWMHNNKHTLGKKPKKIN